MVKVWFAAAAILAFTTHSDAQSRQTLSAPTFYIAASGDYNNYGDLNPNLDVKGVSNLPPGSRLSVTVYDFVGYRSSILSEDAEVVLGKDGFFKVTLRPRKGMQFKDNMVCIVSFTPHGGPQGPSVLKIVGKEGELLGIENNPQIGKNSGGYYLQALVHIP
jgi:hypothetical protein